MPKKRSELGSIGDPWDDDPVLDYLPKTRNLKPGYWILGAILLVILVCFGVFNPFFPVILIATYIFFFISAVVTQTPVNLLGFLVWDLVRLKDLHIATIKSNLIMALITPVFLCILWGLGTIGGVISYFFVALAIGVFILTSKIIYKAKDEGIRMTRNRMNMILLNSIIIVALQNVVYLSLLYIFFTNFRITF